MWVQSGLAAANLRILPCNHECADATDRLTLAITILQTNELSNYYHHPTSTTTLILSSALHTSFPPAPDLSAGSHFHANDYRRGFAR